MPDILISKLISNPSFVEDSFSFVCSILPGIYMVDRWQIMHSIPWVAPIEIVAESVVKEFRRTMLCDDRPAIDLLRERLGEPNVY